MSYVTFKEIGKKYPNAQDYTVENFNIEIEQGEFIVFVGPSGCGKSTTLRMIAGLEEISKGEIIIDETVVNDVHPKDRDIAMVFQNYALYPHMSVYNNIAFGLKIQKVDKVEIEKKVIWAAEILGLTNLLKRKPKDLSGGQRQRVALGRAIVRNPKVFLMDEPLSNLDAKLRVSMRNEITKLHRDLNATTIYVTHDQVEAMTMADRIVVLKDGLIQQIGTPMELYRNPINKFVGSFIGTPQMNFLNAEIAENELIIGKELKLNLDEGLSKKLNGIKNVIIGIRPENSRQERLMLETYPEKIIRKKIINIEKMGSENHVYIDFLGAEFVIKANSQQEMKVGDEIEFILDLNKCHFFDVDTEKRIF